MENVSENESDDDAITNVVNAVWDELLDDAVWEFCFDVHRTVKLNYLFMDPVLDPFHNQRQRNHEAAAAAAAAAENSIPGPKPKQGKNILECPNCKEKYGESYLGGHLPKCLGIKLDRQESARQSRRKIESEAACIEGNEPGAEFSSSSGKKPVKKTSGKKPQKSAAQGTSGSKDVFETMTLDEIKAFLNEKCGVLTKASKRCLNSRKCAQHAIEDKEMVREKYLRMSGDGANNDQIDEKHDDESKSGK